MEEQRVLAVTRRWVSEMVIGLNLCPFARRVSDAGLIRYAITDAVDTKSLLADLARELKELAGAATAAVETTILVHPNALRDFPTYHDFLGSADLLVEDLGLRGVIQIAGFHPDYRFAGSSPEAVENYTNRSPYPLLHLLREESVSAVAGDTARLLEIPRRNSETLKGLGRRAVLARLRAVTDQVVDQ
jgi:hypothetical protein